MDRVLSNRVRAISSCAKAVFANLACDAQRDRPTDWCGEVQEYRVRDLCLPHARNHHIGTDVRFWQFNGYCSCGAKRGKVITEKSRWSVASWFQGEQRCTVWYGTNRSRKVVQLASSRTASLISGTFTEIPLDKPELFSHKREDSYQTGFIHQQELLGPGNKSGMQHSRNWRTVKPSSNIDGSTTGVEGIACIVINVWDDPCVVLIEN